MTDGNTHLDEREDWDALQEVTVELEQAEARIEELEERLKAATDDAKEAETYAEELVAQLSEARQVGKEWFEEQKKARKGANAAEAKLAKAVEDLEFIALNFNKPNAGLSAFGERQHYLFVACRLRDKARTTLAELKGEVDE